MQNKIKMLNYQIIDNHIRIWKDRIENKEKYMTAGKFVFFVEHCVHKISTGKMTGHTHNSLVLAQENFDTVLYISIKKSMCDSLKQHYRLDICDNVIFSTIHNYKDSMCGRSYKYLCVILDFASYFPYNKKKDLYSYLKHFNNVLLLELY